MEDESQVIEADGNGRSRTESEYVGHSPTMTDSSGQRPTMSDREKHTLTTSEVAKRFEISGIPRTQRSIERYCKSGSLSCISDPIENRYYITLESVDRLIAQLKEIKARHSRRTDDGHGRAQSDEDGQRPKGKPWTQAEDATPDEVKGLQDEILNLKIDNSAKKQVIIQLKDEIENDRKRLVDQSRQIGRLETKLRLIQAPTAEDKNIERSFEEN